MADDFVRITPLEDPDYLERISHVSGEVWPEFMLHDSIANDHWEGLFDHFPDCQFALVHQESGSVAGIANRVPVHWQGPLENLPDQGWDWALMKSESDRVEGLHPNLLCALQISIAPGFQGRRLSSRILDQMVRLAGSKQLEALIAPVRPNLKDRYPLMSIDSYISWVREDGLPFDAWLRVHVRNGGQIIKPCPLAMRITGTVAEWEAWTGMTFTETGAYVIPGALVPVSIDLSEDSGLYIEPNVWIVHQVGGAWSVGEPH